jgi:hypothetical protein
MVAVTNGLVALQTALSHTKDLGSRLHWSGPRSKTGRHKQETAPGVPRQCLWLLEPVSDPTPFEVVRADLYLDAVARQDANAVHAHFAGVVGQHFVAVVSLYSESGVFEGLDDGPLEQDGLLLCVRVRQCVLPPPLARCPRASGCRWAGLRYQGQALGTGRSRTGRSRTGRSSTGRSGTAHSGNTNVPVSARA